MGQCLCKEKFLKSRKASAKNANGTPRTGDAAIVERDPQAGGGGGEGEDGGLSSHDPHPSSDSARQPEDSRETVSREYICSVIW